MGELAPQMKSCGLRHNIPVAPAVASHRDIFAALALEITQSRLIRPRDAKSSCDATDF
jgi:hypothetical protein